jgi:hypothetical protein
MYIKLGLAIHLHNKNLYLISCGTIFIPNTRSSISEHGASNSNHGSTKECKLPLNAKYASNYLFSSWMQSLSTPCPLQDVLTISKAI